MVQQEFRVLVSTWKNNLGSATVKLPQPSLAQINWLADIGPFNCHFRTTSTARPAKVLLSRRLQPARRNGTVIHGADVSTRDSRLTSLRSEHTLKHFPDLGKRPGEVCYSSEPKQFACGISCRPSAIRPIACDYLFSLLVEQGDLFTAKAERATLCGFTISKVASDIYIMGRQRPQLAARST